MTELRRGGRHSATAAAAQRPADVEPDEVWVPPPFEPVRPGDFVEYSSSGLEPRRSRHGLVVLLCLLLVVAAGGSWWYLRHRSSPSQTLSCATVQTDLPVTEKLTFVEGGRIPPGVPLPSAPPGRVCSVTDAKDPSGGAAAVWSGTTADDYKVLLQTGGWLVTRDVNGFTYYVNDASPTEVLTTTIEGQLVVLYGTR